MFKAIIALLVVSSYVVAFNSPAARMHSTAKLAMSSLDAKSEAGVSGPLGFFGTFLIVTFSRVVPQLN